jgi:hypothetical protein
MFPESPTSKSHLDQARAYSSDDLLYNGSEPDPLLKRLADEFANTNVSRWMHGVVPATSEELSVFFETSDGSAECVHVSPLSHPSLIQIAA